MKTILLFRHSATTSQAVTSMRENWFYVLPRCQQIEIAYYLCRFDEQHWYYEFLSCVKCCTSSYVFVYPACKFTKYMLVCNLHWHTKWRKIVQARDWGHWVFYFTWLVCLFYGVDYSTGLISLKSTLIYDGIFSRVLSAYFLDSNSFPYAKVWSFTVKTKYGGKI